MSEWPTDEGAESSVPSGPPSLPDSLEAANPPTPVEQVSRPRSARGWIIALAVLLVAALGGGAYVVVELLRTQTDLKESELLNDERQGVIDEQNEMLDEKETFGAAMEELMSNARALDGIPTASLVSIDEYERLAVDAWAKRRSPAAVAFLTDTVRDDTESLRLLVEAATAERGSNASGTLGEARADQLGMGIVKVSFEGLEATCGADAAGCVTSTEPTIIRLDPADYFAEYNDDSIRTFLVDHEFAHVLQFTNPVPTESAVAAFGTDYEFMADCYALTVADSWTLDHQVFVSDFEYYDVSVGYGRVCDAPQRDVIRDWLSQTGFRYRTISQ